MATQMVSVPLPENLKQYVERRAAEDGYEDAGDFICELIRQDQEAHQGRTQEQLEALLLEGQESLDRGERIIVTPEYWEDFRREARERLAQLRADEKKA
jgi:Arc/MetJ-type ribon-helix-helix transcriptional regulator